MRPPLMIKCTVAVKSLRNVLKDEGMTVWDFMLGGVSGRFGTENG